VKLSCHCGGTRIQLHKRPDFIYACNCSLCTKSGARWAYLHPSEVAVEGASTVYSRTDKGEPSAEIRFCASCGCTTHFTLTPGAIARFGNSMMGVNMQLADEADLAGLELRYPDGRAWAGAGDFGYVRPSQVIGAPHAGD
jgi:hypothetical protein